MRSYSKIIYGVAMSLAGGLIFQMIMPAWSQPPNIASSRGYPEDLYSQAVFKKAHALRDSFRYQEAVTELQRIADAAVGTETEAAARTMKATTLRLIGSQLDRSHLSQWQAQARQEYQLIAQRFPNSKYWLSATIDLGTGPQATEQLLVQLGGPSYESIRTGRARINESSIPLAYRDIMADVYYGQPSLTSMSQTEKIRFFSFLRSSFPTSGTNSPDLELRELLLPPNTQTIEVTPEIDIKKPKANSSIKSKKAALEAELSNGPIQASQIDLRASKIQLDGQDILLSCSLESDIKPSGSTYEKISVEYIPTTPLSIGPHQYRILVVTNGGQRSAERVLSFTVRADSGPD